MAQEHTASAESTPVATATLPQRPGKRLAAFKAAFPLTVPICLGFLFLGASYGILMGTKGFSFVWPMCMSAFIFAGSMEFVTVNLLLSAFNPLAGFLLALMVNARHLFYGLSMLGRFKGLGWKRPYLIFGMCDETYAVNSTAHIPDTVDRGWFYFWVTALNQCYWVIGATAGGIIGSHLPFDTTGLDFVLTALFLVIFLDQWLGGKHRERLSAVIGVLAALGCLVVFGADNFMIPAMITMLVLFTVLRPHLDTLNIQPTQTTDNATAGKEDHQS
ncbi:AzlC family ABC transporter permease [Bifidobacterium sp. LC6]|uniref:AzlC family ABC transporter permease n=1 Tax=Bifidobacterium colobi TaxID=2809026 RepID=A0ABS5UY86_9BIFI|nr:AzlC family ABC transporter permease [Bifidobacterium colobi]MBT1175637.1 AzlC family ABC transporter permease [Bifidobacterium colobi]